VGHHCFDLAAKALLIKLERSFALAIDALLSTVQDLEICSHKNTSLPNISISRRNLLIVVLYGRRDCEV
jgi:hypothetical protein